LSDPFSQSFHQNTDEACFLVQFFYPLSLKIPTRLSLRSIDQKLKSIGVEGIDWNPAAHDEGKITDYAVKIVANDLPPIRETPDEKPDGEQSKGEEQIAIERFHARGCRGMREGGREGK